MFKILWIDKNKFTLKLWSSKAVEVQQRTSVHFVNNLLRMVVNHCFSWVITYLVLFKWLLYLWAKRIMAGNTSFTPTSVTGLRDRDKLEWLAARRNHSRMLTSCTCHEIENRTIPRYAFIFILLSLLPS